MNSSYMTRQVAAIIIAISTGFFILIQAGCEKKKALESVTIAVSRQPISAPVYLAYDKKLFEQEGLRVTFLQYSTGKECLDAVINHKAEFSTVAETPVMLAAFKNEPVLVIATIADSDNYMKIVARRDRKIADARDLSGKKIGVSPGTNAEYFIDAYLTFKGISKDAIQRVPLKPEAMAGALAEGTIDAAVSWEPHAAKQRTKLVENSVELKNEQIYQISWNIVSHRKFTEVRPEAVQKLLRALLQAQEYLAEHPQEALTITARYIGEDNFSLADYNFDVRLGQSLVLDLEEQARWALRNGLTDKKEIPNFLSLLYFKGMEAVAPESVITVPHP